jgi:hypothetical protein
MFDNHTFERLDDDVLIAIKRAIELFDIDSYGCVGVKNEMMNKLVVHGRGDKDKFVNDLNMWAASYCDTIDKFHIITSS